MRSVTEFGARGDSRQDDYPAFAAALAAGLHALYVPAGKYRLHGMLVLPSDFSLVLHPEAYMILDDNTGGEVCPYLLTAAPGSRSVQVRGGVWEGNCRRNKRTADYRGILISFSDVAGLRLSHMTVRNSEAFHIRLNYVTDFVLEHIVFDDKDQRFTQDGIHLGGGCENGVIRHIRGVGPSSPNDDMISLCADFSPENMAPSDPIWGQRPGPIRNIEIAHIKADNTFSFLRLFSLREPIENVYAHHVAGGCYYLAVQMEISPYLRNRPRQYDPAAVYGAGNIRHIRLEDFAVYTRLFYGNRRRDYFRNYVGGMIDIEQSVEDLSIRRFRRVMAKDAKGESLPTLCLRNYRANRIVQPHITQTINAGPTPWLVQGNIETLDLTTQPKE